jgi:glutathione S-transferase
MISHYGWTALATLLALAVYFAASLQVGRARGKYGVKAPAVTGDPGFERAFRAQQNTLEWMPLFLPALWLFALTLGDPWAGALGAAWALARLGFVVAYAAAADRRGPWFGAQAAIFAVLWLGALIGVIKAIT